MLFHILGNWRRWIGH